MTDTDPMFWGIVIAVVCVFACFLTVLSYIARREP